MNIVNFEKSLCALSLSCFQLSLSLFLLCSLFLSLSVSLFFSFSLSVCLCFQFDFNQRKRIPNTFSFDIRSLSQYYEFSKDQDYICSTPEDSGMHLCGNFPPYRIGSLICTGEYERKGMACLPIPLSSIPTTPPPQPPFPFPISTQTETLFTFQAQMKCKRGVLIKF